MFLSLLGLFLKFLSVYRVCVCVPRVSQDPSAKYHELQHLTLRLAIEILFRYQRTHPVMQVNNGSGERAGM